MAFRFSKKLNCLHLGVIAGELAGRWGDTWLKKGKEYGRCRQNGVLMVSCPLALLGLGMKAASPLSWWQRFWGYASCRWWWRRKHKLDGWYALPRRDGQGCTFASLFQFFEKFDDLPELGLHFLLSCLKLKKWAEAQTDMSSYFHHQVHLKLFENIYWSLCTHVFAYPRP